MLAPGLRAEPLLLPAFAPVARSLPLNGRPVGERVAFDRPNESAQAGRASQGELDQPVDQLGVVDPLAAHIRGNIESGVKPGIVLISLTTSCRRR